MNEKKNSKRLKKINFFSKSYQTIKYWLSLENIWVHRFLTVETLQKR